MSDNSHRPGEPPPETPRFEPEIIPPSRDGAPRPGDAGVFVYVDAQGRTRRTAFKPPSTFVIVLTLLIVGIVAATLLVLVLGFVLVWIPIAVVAIVALILTARIRGFWQRLRGGA